MSALVSQEIACGKDVAASASSKNAPYSVSSSSERGRRNRRLPYLARNSSPQAESAALEEQGRRAAKAEPLTAAPTAAAVESTSRAVCLLTTRRAASLSKPKCE